jgi:hypothetical protein
VKTLEMNVLTQPLMQLPIVVGVEFTRQFCLHASAVVRAV